MEFILLPPKSPIIFTVNGFPIRYYGLIMGCVFALGVLFSYLIIKKKVNSNESNLFLDYSPIVIFLSIIGARVFYVVGSFNFYFNNPKEIFLINHGGLSIFGAIFFGIITIFILSKIKKFNFWAHIDVLAVVFPLCQAVGRFGNFFNQEAYGAPTSGFLKLFVSPEYRRPELANIEYYHPTFLYESVLDLFIFALISSIYFNSIKLRNGSIACLYLIFYSIVRFIIEGIRIDSVLNVASIPIARIICVLLFLIAIVSLFLLNKKAPNELGA